MILIFIFDIKEYQNSKKHNHAQNSNQEERFFYLLKKQIL